MVDAPTLVTEKQLRELHIRLRNTQVANLRGQSLRYSQVQGTRAFRSAELNQVKQ